ncbi:hypothetical protein LINPERHAP2_LOCUS11241 [Linum perenne]
MEGPKNSIVEHLLWQKRKRFKWLSRKLLTFQVDR